MTVFRYLANWIEGASNAAPEERATVANLQLFLDDQNVTMHLRDNVAFDHVVVSLYPLVEGLVHDWWTIFGDRDENISLIKYRAGYVLPDIRFRYDGNAFEVAAFQRIYRNPNVRFWAGATEIMSREDAERTLSEFITAVLERLKSERVSDSSAALRWSRVLASREDDEEAAFCECAGALGRDPYAIDISLSTLIDHAAQMFADEPLNEFLAGSKTFSAAALLEWIRRAESRSSGKSAMHELSSVAKEISKGVPVRASERPWSLGYRRARAVRQYMDIEQGVRFKSLRDLSRTFGASNNFAVADRVDGLRALRSDHNGAVSIHLRDHGSSAEAESGARFSLARAIGDVICFPDSARAVVNELHYASRQAAGRAFAAELLAPIDEIDSMRADSHDLVTIADEFGVSTVLIEHQIENASRIAQACQAV